MSAVTTFKVKRQLTDLEFDQLFREHYQLVYRTAFSVTRSDQDAEDVLQTVFMGLVRREFPPGLKKNPKAYLYRSAFNRAVDIVRARSRDLFPADAERIANAVSNDWKFAEDAERRLYEAISKPGVNPGQFLVTLMAVLEASYYEFRWAPMNAGAPGQWTMIPVTKVRPAISVTGLTPGTTYAFQVRSLTDAGYSDWSDSITKICN